jgi:hypothetical protein
MQIVVRPDGRVMFGTITEEMLDIVKALSPPDQPPRAAQTHPDGPNLAQPEP